MRDDQIMALTLVRKLLEAAAMSLPKEAAAPFVTFHPEWQAGTQYATGDRFQFGGKLYTAKVAHLSDQTKAPDKAADLYELIENAA